MVMSSVVIYSDKDFSVRMELLSGQPFMHVDVSNYNKHVKSKMLSVWEDIKHEMWLDGWAAIFSYNTNSKFAKMFGWSRKEGYPEGMYSWELK